MAVLTANGRSGLMDALFGGAPGPGITGLEVYSDTQSYHVFSLSGKTSSAIQGVSELLVSVDSVQITPMVTSLSLITYALVASGGRVLGPSIPMGSVPLDTTPLFATNMPLGAVRLNGLKITVPDTLGGLRLNDQLRNEICNLLVKGVAKSPAWLGPGARIDFYNLSRLGGNSTETLADAYLVGSAPISAANFVVSGGTAQLAAPITVTGLGDTSRPITHAIIGQNSTLVARPWVSIPSLSGLNLIFQYLNQPAWGSSVVCLAGGLSGNIRTNVASSGDNGATFDIVSFNLAIG